MLAPDNEYQSRVMVVGFCPNCCNIILEMHSQDFKGKLHTKTYRREKAKKMYEKMQCDIIGDYVSKVKFGTRSNMSFHYGDNKEIRNTKGVVVGFRQYSVDFNGTREIVRTRFEENKKNSSS